VGLKARAVLKNKNMKNGFTLIEFLIVIAIMLFMSAVGLAMFSNLHGSTQLNENVLQIIQTLKIARERSVASYNNSAHGVFLTITNPYKYVLYQGNSYVTRNASFDRGVIFDAALSLNTSDIVLTGGNIDINFSQSSGQPNNTGTIIVTHNSATSRLIKINSIGLVEEN